MRKDSIVWPLYANRDKAPFRQASGSELREDILTAGTHADSGMNKPASPKYFEFREGHAFYAPIGLVSLQEATRLVKEAIAFSREHQIPRLLADLTQLTGFPSPSIPERYWIVREWAHSATSRVEVAIVLQPYMIDPEHFGVLVAVNLGMRADVFSERPAALAWLLSGKPSSVQT